MAELYEIYSVRRKSDGCIKTTDMTVPDRAHRLKQARLASGYDTAWAAADAFNWNRNTYASNENGNAPFSYRRAKIYAEAFRVRSEWLYDSDGPQQLTDGHVPVLGRVGADPSGRVTFASGQGGDETVPIPPGGSDQAVALRVTGSSMRGLADDGALIYFEDQRTPPSADMLGHVVVLETESEEVLVKRLLRGAKRGLYNLESVDGPLRENVRLRWAAHITAIIPPFQARKILRQAQAS